MTVYVFGSCSGTEPIPGRHHVSFALEVNSRIYWFDAGEGCSYTAHNMGVNLLKVSDIFISHSHMDHVGGLCNLLWNIRKLSDRFKTVPDSNEIRVYIPNSEMWDGIWKLLKNSEGNYACSYDTKAVGISDGVLISGDVTVVAHHNRHLPIKDGKPQSFSFKIEAEDTVIVYSADIMDFEDITPLLREGCDMLFVETGHNDPVDICKRAKQYGGKIKNLYFIHHGRKILNNYEKMLAAAQKAFDGKVVFCNDGDIFKF